MRALHTVVVFFHLVIEPIDEFHVEIEPTAKIFVAVSGTKASCGSRRCLLSSDAVAAMTAFVLAI